MSLAIIDLDELFKSLETPPIILNNQEILTQEGREAFDKLLYTQYTEDSLSPTPSCQCGQMRGRYKLGVQCTSCLTYVEEPIKTEIDPLVWMAAPKKIRYLMPPIIWYMLTTKIKSGGYSYVKWMTDPNYRPVSGQIPPRLPWMLEQGHRRGYNYFVKNFETVMRDLVFGDGRKKPKESHVHLYELCMENREKLFVKHIPIPSKVAFVIEESAGRRWADKTMNLAIDAVRRMQETEQVLDSLSLRNLESRVTKILDSMGEFYHEFIRSNWDGKTKIFRKHVFGARLHFTARAVITSLTNAHNKSELHFPWAMSLQLFKIHIASKLIHRGYSAEAALSMINGHAHVYHPLLDEIFKELINESKYMGLPVIFQRNPTLSRASAQLLYVTKVKPNPADNTISNSVLAISGNNADYDGDQMNVTYLESNFLVESFKRLDPSYNVMSFNTPHELSGNLKMPAPVIATIANWFNHENLNKE